MAMGDGGCSGWPSTTMSMWPAEIQSSLMVYILGDPLHDIRCLLAEHSDFEIQIERKFYIEG